MQTTLNVQKHRLSQVCACNMLGSKALSFNTCNPWSPGAAQSLSCKLSPTHIFVELLTGLFEQNRPVTNRTCSSGPCMVFDNSSSSSSSACSSDWAIYETGNCPELMFIDCLRGCCFLSLVLACSTIWLQHIRHSLGRHLKVQCSLLHAPCRCLPLSSSAQSPSSATSPAQQGL